MTRDEIRKLQAAYDRRDAAAHAHEYADSKNYWLAIVNEAFGGSGTRAAVAEASGGRGELADLLHQVVSRHLHVKVVDADEEIRKLGGSP